MSLLDTDREPGNAPAAFLGFRRRGSPCSPRWRRSAKAGLRLAVSRTDVASISWSRGNTCSPRPRWPRCSPYCWERPLQRGTDRDVLASEGLVQALPRSGPGAKPGGL